MCLCVFVLHVMYDMTIEILNLKWDCFILGGGVEWMTRDDNDEEDKVAAETTASIKGNMQNGSTPNSNNQW